MIALMNPRDPWNLANIVRVVSNFEYPHDIVYSGTEMGKALSEMDKHPRPLRSKYYSHVKIGYRPKIVPVDGFIPVCIEVDGTIDLPNFPHPEKAMYIFGPESGSIPGHIKRFCHYTVKIPTIGCMNLAAAVTTVLYDRLMKTK